MSKSATIAPNDYSAMGNIGKYRLEEEIGRGGFGQVYRAFDPAMDRMVAIKILLSQTDKDQLARFKNEANATGKLRHKNIVTVYDYGEYANKPYLVMEYLEGEDLQAIQSSSRSLSLLEKISIMSQLAEGLQHAHHAVIVHRDVKPANIMILKDGTAKIMDFGIARALVDPERLTQDGSLLGTLSYMAPETFLGTDVDQLCDIFSAGVIFYELLMSRHPFAADAPGRVIYNISLTNPPSVSTSISDAPMGLDQLIARAIHKDRALRYQSTDDLLLDLMPIRLQLEAKEARTLIQKAQALLDTAQIQDAQEVVRQALLLDPNNKSGRDLREKITRKANGQLMRHRCDQLLASGKQNFTAERYCKAVEILESLLRLDPDHTEALTLLQQSRAAERKRERVAALIAQATRELEEDQLTRAYRSILECFQHAPDNKEAASLLETIRASIERRERERRLAESLAKLGGLMAADELDEAESLMTDLEVNYPGAARVQQLASEVRQASREKKRRKELAQALDGVRGILDQQRWQDAVTTLDRVSKQFPNEPEVRSLAAYAEEELKAQQKADYIERVGRETRSACDSHEFDGAMRLLKGALETYPREAAFEAMLRRTTQLRNEYQAQQTVESAKHIKDRIEQREYQKAIDAGREALEKFQNNTIIEGLLNLADMALSEEKRAIQISKSCADAESLASRQDYDGALRLVRDTLQELGNDPALMRLDADITERASKQRPAPSVCEEKKLLEGEFPKRDDTVGMSRVEIAKKYNQTHAARNRRTLSLAAAILLLVGVVAGAITFGKSTPDVSTDRTTTAAPVENASAPTPEVPSPDYPPKQTEEPKLIVTGSDAVKIPDSFTVVAGEKVPTAVDSLPVVTSERSPQEPAIEPIPVPPPSPPGPPASARAWSSLQHSTNIPELQQFLREFPNSPEAALAAALIKNNEDRLAAEKASADKAAAEKAAADRAAAEKAAAEKLAAQIQAEIEAIKTVLIRHAAAYTKEDLNTIASTWPRANLGEHFRNVTVENYELQPQSNPVFRNDQEATIDVRLVSREVTKGGRRDEQNAENRVLLRKEKGSWTIQSLQPR